MECYVLYRKNVHVCDARAKMNHLVIVFVLYLHLFQKNATGNFFFPFVKFFSFLVKKILIKVLLVFWCLFYYYSVQEPFNKDDDDDDVATSDAFNIEIYCFIYEIHLEFLIWKKKILSNWLRKIHLFEWSAFKGRI